MKLLSLWKLTTPNFKALLALCNGPHSVSGVCFSLYLNKSTSYLSLCLSLNSFCNETSRNWASLGPETRYPGFWLGLSPSHVGSSPKQVLAGSESQPCGFKSQAGFWLDLSPSHVDSSPNMIQTVSIPPLPSPTESQSLFFISMSLLLSHIHGHHYHLSKFHIYVLIYCIVFLSDLLHSV